MVGKVLAEGETAVGIQIRQHLDVTEEISIHISTLVETFCIFSCPPVLQITASIILTTLIIESVSHLMTDYYADSTIVECSISLRIEERILENTSWEADLIGSRIVVSVHGLRSHEPLIPIYWLSCLLCNLLIVGKLAASHYVLIIALRWVDAELAEISPLVRITNLYIELVEFVVGSFLCSIAHPGLSIDTLTEADLKILHECLHHLLRAFWEIALTVDATERLAQLSLNLNSSALPKRIILLTATHNLTEEFETGFANLIAEVRSRTTDDVPLHQSLQCACTFCSCHLVITGKESRLTYDHLLEIFALDSLGVGKCLERNVRIILLEFCQGHLVVVGLRITKFGTALRESSERCFVKEYGRSLLGSFISRETIELEHLAEVRLISLTDSYGCSIVVEVIILGTESKTALHQVVDVHGYVLLIGSETCAIAQAEPHPCILNLKLLKLVLGLGSFYLIHQRLYWSDSSLVAAVNIHREFVEIRQFLLNGSSLVSLLLEFRKNGVDALVVVLSQPFKTAITAVSGRKRIVLLPSTCSKLIETVCWLHCLVEIAHDKTRFILSISA